MDWISIDPAVKKNLALRVERRHSSGKIESIVFAKCAFKEIVVMNGVSVDLSFRNITTFLDRFKSLYMTCHIYITERQMPINYKSNRVAQHVMSYFMNLLKDSIHLPMFYEIQASIKTKWLPHPEGLTDIKTWGSQEAYKLLEWRGDSFGMQVMKDNWEKQDDLADTVIQIEAVAKMLGYPTTPEPQVLEPIQQGHYPAVPHVAIPTFTTTSATTPLSSSSTTTPLTSAYYNSGYLVSSQYMPVPSQGASSQLVNTQPVFAFTGSSAVTQSAQPRFDWR